MTIYINFGSLFVEKKRYFLKIGHKNKVDDSLSGIKEAGYDDKERVSLRNKDTENGSCMVCALILPIFSFHNVKTKVNKKSGSKIGTGLICPDLDLTLQTLSKEVLSQLFLAPTSSTFDRRLH
jgi:hypothetical protein